MLSPSLYLTFNVSMVCRYRANFDKNAEFAQLLQQKLVAYKADDHSMGDVSCFQTIFVELSVQQTCS